MRLDRNRFAYIAASFICAAVFLWLFAKSADWPQVLVIVKGSNIAWLALAVLTLLLDFFIRLMRWKFILGKHNPDITLAQCFTPYFSSFALNNLLPFRLGDVARATLFNRKIGVAVHPVVSSLMLERITDLVSLLLLFFCSLIALSIDLDSHPVFAYIVAVSLPALLAVGALLVFPDRIARQIEHGRCYVETKNWAHVEKVIKFIQKIVDSFNMHIGVKSYSILLLAASAAWVFEAITFALVAYSLNMPLMIDESFFVMSMATLSTLLPSTPGYVGTFDYLCKLSLTFLGYDDNRAVAASILMHIVNLVPITLIGASAFIIYFGRSWKNKILSSFQGG